MTRRTLIQGLRRAILRRVRSAERAEVFAFLALLEDQYSALMSAVQQESYQEGVTAERKRQEQAEASGFDLGYKHGLERAIGNIGQPARRVDEDELAVPPC